MSASRIQNYRYALKSLITEQSKSKNFNAVIAALGAYILKQAAKFIYPASGPINFSYITLARDPFHSCGESCYEQESILMPLIAHALGMDSSVDTIIQFIKWTRSATLIMLGFYLGKQYGWRLAMVALCALVLHPVVMTLYTWRILPDVYSFLTAAVLLFVRNPTSLFIVAILGSLNHFPQMIPIVFFISLLRSYELYREGHFDVRLPLAMFLGILTGKALLLLYLNHFGIEMHTGHFAVTREIGLSAFTVLNLRNPIMSILSLNHTLWALILMIVGFSYTRDRIYALLFGLAIFAALIPAYISLDTTRIYSLIAWPIFLHGFLYCQKLINKTKESRKMKIFWYSGIGFTLSVALLLPKFYYSSGKVIFLEGLIPSG